MDELRASYGAVLDYGCGKGTLSRVTGYDPAIVGKDGLPEPHPVVVCLDVLEHVEPELMVSVLDHLQALAQEVVFIVIATGPAQKVLPDGRNAHLIQESAGWWYGRLLARWKPVFLREEPAGFAFLGTCRK